MRNISIRRSSVKERPLPVSPSSHPTRLCDPVKTLLQKQILVDILILLSLTMMAILVHGYHLGLEDEAVYLPAIKYQLDPGLYPHDSIFFLQQMKLTLYDELIALAIRLSHLKIELFIFVIHIFSVFLILLGCLGLSRRLFSTLAAQWGAVTLIVTILTIPVTGSALLLVDQYLHPRSFATAFILFAIVNILDKQFLRAASWLVISGIISPLMALYGISFIVLLLLQTNVLDSFRPLKMSFSLGLVSQSNIPIWNEVTRPYYYLAKWTWYELLGVVAPLVILFLLSFVRSSYVLPSFRLVSRRLSVFGLLFALISLALGTPSLEKFLSIQPMRSFHLVYLIFFLILGGMIGQEVLKNKPARWFLLFLPLCLGMFFTQRYQFSASDHIEWPGKKPTNQWVQAFEWIRDNTPQNAFFALDPCFMENNESDFHGFRALAERSMMADLVKDPAVVSVLFTANKLMANNFVGVSGACAKWHDQVTALKGWQDFRIEDFRRLKQQFGVDWVVLERPGLNNLTCPYANDAVMVCHID